jgi:hypothetical protein
MGEKNNKSQDKLRFTLTSRNGTKAKLEVSQQEMVNILKELGFGSDSKPTRIENNHSNKPLSNKDKEKTDNFLNDFSKFERVKILIRSISKNSGQWFTSKDILGLYEKYLTDRVSLSTISTYLSRLESQKILFKRGSKRDLEYCLNRTALDSIPEINLLEKDLSVKKT